MRLAVYGLICAVECVAILGVSSIFFSMNLKQKKVEKIRKKIEKKFNIKEKNYFNIGFTLMILAAIIPIIHIIIMYMIFGLKC